MRLYLQEQHRHAQSLSIVVILIEEDVAFNTKSHYIRVCYVRDTVHVSIAEMWEMTQLAE